MAPRLPLLLASALLAACVGSGELPQPTPEPLGDDDSAPADDDDAGPAAPHPVFDPDRVHDLTITVSPESIDALRDTPRGWVRASIEFDDEALDDVAVRLKGSSSFQDVDHKPALKIKMDEYVPGLRLLGLERLTLNNEVWDPTMMAETMAYRAFRAAGSPAPRTGYTVVTLNERRLGLYAIIESMDDQFMEFNWPDSEGGMWEMTRSCDFDSDCTCFDLQETGEAFVPDGIDHGCAAVARSGVGALDEAFDRDAVIGFLAAERAVNHPDSYTFNGNNFFVHHHPGEDALSLIPWGADSTFIYAYPPSTPNPDCRPLHKDVLSAPVRGRLSVLCDADPACRAELVARILAVADWMEAVDLVADMEANRDLLAPHAAGERYVNWTAADRERRIGCFLEWTGRRPSELRGRLGR